MKTPVASLVRAVVITGFLLPFAAFAAEDVYIKIDDINGERKEHATATSTPAVGADSATILDLPLQLFNGVKTDDDATDTERDEMDDTKNADVTMDMSVDAGDEIMVILRPAPGASDDDGVESFIASLVAHDALKVSIEADDKGGSRPKEIVVVGSKVRDAVKSEGASKVTVRGWDPKNKSAIQNGEDLAVVVAATTANDTAIEHVALNFEKITLVYKGQGWLFGFVSFSYLQDVEVSLDPESDSRVKVKFPWYRFLLSSDVTEDELAYEIESEIDASDAIDPDEDEPSAKTQAQVFVALSNVLKAHHDTAMNSVRNMK